MGIDQTRDCSCAAGIDHDIAAFDVLRGRDADALDTAIARDDGVAARERLLPIPGDDGANIDDRGPHLRLGAISA